MNIVNEINNKINNLFRVKIDDRENLSPGFKFNEWELKGVPLRIEIGPKDIENGSVIFSRRDGIDGKFSVPISEIQHKIRSVLDEIQDNLLESSKQYQKNNTIHVESKSELIESLNSKPGFVTCYWHENSDDENEIKEHTKATLRCYLLDSKETNNSVNKPSEQGKLAIFSKAY
jgi:prolyl-tRNA synthetase